MLEPHERVLGAVAAFAVVYLLRKTLKEVVEVVEHGLKFSRRSFQRGRHIVSIENVVFGVDGGEHSQQVLLLGKALAVNDN